MHCCIPTWLQRADNGAAEADVRFSLITELYRRRFLKRSSRSRLHRTIYRAATIACNRALVFGRADTFFNADKRRERCCRSRKAGACVFDGSIIRPSLPDTKLRAKISLRYLRASRKKNSQERERSLSLSLSISIYLGLFHVKNGIAQRAVHNPLRVLLTFHRSRESSVYSRASSMGESLLVTFPICCRLSRSA